MNKHRISLGCAVLLLALAVICTGCWRHQPPKEEPFNFHSLSQQERKDYITDYLQQTYGLSCTINLDVAQRQDGPFLLEDEYFAVVSTEDHHIISVWVTKQGQITDTVFLLERLDDFTNYFTPQVQKILPECSVYADAFLPVLPTEILTPSGDIRTYLTEQPTEITLRIAVEDPDSVTDAQMKQLVEQFSYCNITILLYGCDDVEVVDWDTLSTGPFLRHEYSHKPD